MPSPLDLISTEHRGRAAVAETKGSTHCFYEDRSRMLSVATPLVREADRGEIFAVFDGVGSAPMGMRAAEAMADAMIEFFEKPDAWKDTATGLENLIREGSQRILDWGFMDGTDRPLGAAAGTIAWMIDGDILLYHAGDTEAWVREGVRCRSLLPECAEGEDIVQYFGRGQDLDLVTVEVYAGEADRLLLFSDGLRKCVYQSAIDEALQSTAPKEAIVRGLVEKAVKVGAPDDVTVMLVELGGEI